MTSLDGMRVASEESGAVDVGQSAEAPHGSGAVAALPAVAVIHAGLSDTPLDTQALVDLVRRADSGAIVVFEGTVRSPNHGHEVEALVYEAWLERVPEQLHRIASEVADHTRVCSVPSRSTGSAVSESVNLRLWLWQWLSTGVRLSEGLKS
ncbi:MAG: molybdenum cofactor biosynthesis protein MoaE [Microthrixaceae bacterium]